MLLLYSISLPLSYGWAIVLVGTNAKQAFHQKTKYVQYTEPSTCSILNLEDKLVQHSTSVHTVPIADLVSYADHRGIL